MNVHDEDRPVCVTGLGKCVQVAEVEPGIPERETKVSAGVMVGHTCSSALPRRTERSAYIRPQAVSELLVRDELEQAAVRVAEVHAGALAPGAAARHRPKLDLDAMRFEVFCSPGDRPGPHEAKVTTAGRHRNPRERLRFAASGAVHIQLLAAEAIHRDTVLVTDQLGGQYIPVEGVRASAIGDVDNPVVEVELDE